MGKDIGKFYQYSQSILSTLSLKAPVNSSFDPQTLSAIKLPTTSVPSVREKKSEQFRFYSQTTIQNDASIISNDNIQSYETEKKL